MKNKNKNKITHKQSSYFTFMLIPEGSANVISLRFPRWIAYMAILSVVFIFITVTVTSISAAKSKERVNSFNNQLLETNEENTRLMAEKDMIVEEIKSKEQSYNEKLQDLDEKALEVEQKLQELEDLKEDIMKEMTSSKASPIRMSDFKSGNNYVTSIDSTNNAEKDKKLLANYINLENRITNELSNYYSISEKMAVYTRFRKSYPTIMPVSGRITSNIGYRTNPFGGSGSEGHTGIDIKVSTGTKVKATAAGTVKFSGVLGGYGKLVIINHGYGYETYYAHNSELLVSAGDKVSRYDVIAKSGSTGRSTGPHVHYEVRLNGQIENPRNYIEED